MSEKKEIISTVPSLIGAKMYLRPATPEDIANTHHWTIMRDPQRFSEYPSSYTTASEAAEAYKKTEKSPDRQSFVMIALKENTLVGLIAFSDLNNLNRSARISMVIDPDEAKKDHGPEAIRILCTHLFRYRGLNKVYAYVSALDEMMSRDLTRVGFKQEGVLRQHIFYKGQFHDMFLYSLLLFDFGE